MTNDEKKLLEELQAADFSLDEIILYLDTHPCDKKALEHYQKCKKERDIALENYTSVFGPITADNLSPSDRFSWIDNPWPWEVTE